MLTKAEFEQIKVMLNLMGNVTAENVLKLLGTFVGEYHYPAIEPPDSIKNYQSTSYPSYSPPVMAMYMVAPYRPTITSDTVATTDSVIVSTKDLEES